MFSFAEQWEIDFGVRFGSQYNMFIHNILLFVTILIEVVGDLERLDVGSEVICVVVMI